MTAEPPANDRETARSLGNAATMFAVTPASARLAGQRTTDLGATADPASQDPGSAPLPTRLGRYHVLERLGSGGMGVVFAAYDPDLDRKVAVKLLRVDRPGSDSQLRLLREAQALARLSHPNVVQVHDAGTLGDQVFVAMEFVRGHDLRAWLTGPPRPQADILRMFVAAGHGLAAAHDAGLVHRDFKPENVLVGADGRARVADFGLARHGPDADPEAHPDADARPPQTALDVSLTATGAVLGTPAYMSPEQHLGQPADARSDQFAFCVALWEALYDRRPFVGGTYVELRTSVLAGTLVPPPAGTRVPRRLGELLRRGLATEPGQRHASMHALLEALVRDPARARRRWLAGAVLSTMALGTAFAFADWRASAANVCSGGADELASTWNDERRAALSVALAAAPDPDLAALTTAGLDRYTAEWIAAHRDACVDHHRSEQTDALFDARMRCLGRRRGALASALTVLTSPAATPPDAAQVVAKLPRIATCDDRDAVLADAPLPEDPAAASAVRDLDVRLLAARTRHHAGDIDGARTATREVIDAARTLEFRPLLADALLAQGQIDMTAGDRSAAHAVLGEAHVHALAARRDEIAAETAARQIFLDGALGRADAAFAAEPVARALADRLPAPAAALARLDNNLGVVHLARRDLGPAREQFTRATAALAHAPDIDAVEAGGYWTNLAMATTEPAARRAAFARAADILTGALGPNHLLVLEFHHLRALKAADFAESAEILTGVCPRFPVLYPAARARCTQCFYLLAHANASLGHTARAADDFAAVRGCPASPTDAALENDLAVREGKAAAFEAALRGDPAAALGHADTTLTRTVPDSKLWWERGDVAELQLARGRALLALGRPADAVTALSAAIPALQEFAGYSVMYSPWLVDAEAHLRRAQDAASTRP